MLIRLRIRSHEQHRFTLVPGQWYAMEYLHSGTDLFLHRSPILVFDVVPKKTGRNLVGLDFFHANYSPGVQRKRYLLRVIKRAGQYLVADRQSEDDHEHSTVIIHDISWAWLDLHFPGLSEDSGGEESAQASLNHHFNDPAKH